MITVFLILVTLFMVYTILMIANGIISYQKTSCPQYVKATKWLAFGSVMTSIGIFILCVVAVNRIPKVGHLSSDSDVVEVTETVEVEPVEVHHASETISIEKL